MISIRSLQHLGLAAALGLLSLQASPSALGFRPR